MNYKQQWKALGRIENFDGDDIDIEGEEGWEKGLIIKDCPNLTYLNFNSCDLKKITIQNCPNLKVIEGHNNQLEVLKLVNFPKLEEVSVPFNPKMRDLVISNCPKIHTIFCFNNNLRSLPKLQQFKQLKKLHCYKNSNLSSVICKDLNHLEELNAQECNIQTANFENCEKLRILDLAENRIRKLNIGDCVNLVEFSCRDNLLKDIDLSNNQELTSLILYNNLFPPLDISKFSHLTKLKSLAMGLYFVGDIKEEVVKKNLNRILEYGGSNRFYGSLEAFKEMKNLQQVIINATDINEGQEYLPASVNFLNCETFEKEFNLWKILAKGSNSTYFEPRKVKAIYDWWQVEKVRRQKEKEQQEINNPAPNDPDEIPEPITSISGWGKGRKETNACDCELPKDKSEVRFLNLSHWRLKGDLVVEDYPKLKELNLGNNKLTGLIVRNCPRLEILIYSHNKMEQEAKIEKCDNLKEIHNENYDGSNEWDKHMNLEEIEREEARAEGNKLAIKFNNMVYDLLKRAENGENIAFSEIVKFLKEINITLIDEEYRVKLLNLYERKFEETHPQAYNQIVAEKLLVLIARAEKALAKKDWDELKEILQEMKKYLNTDAYRDKKEIIAKFERLLLNQGNENNSVLSPKIYLSLFLIGSFPIVLTTIIIPLVARLVRKKNKASLKKVIN